MMVSDVRYLVALTVASLVLVVVSTWDTDETIVITKTEAKPTQLQDGAKLRARQMVQDPKQYRCLSDIMNKESKWNPYARNGSHYGMGQMRSVWYRDLDALAQVDATVAYIIHRYGNPCNALAFHHLRNYY